MTVNVTFITEVYVNRGIYGNDHGSFHLERKEMKREDSRPLKRMMKSSELLV